MSFLWWKEVKIVSVLTSQCLHCHCKYSNSSYPADRLSDRNRRRYFSANQCSSFYLLNFVTIQCKLSDFTTCSALTNPALDRNRSLLRGARELRGSPQSHASEMQRATRFERFASAGLGGTIVGASPCFWEAYRRGFMYESACLGVTGCFNDSGPIIIVITRTLVRPVLCWSPQSSGRSKIKNAVQD